MLSVTPEELRGETDVAAHAAAVLAESRIRQVVLLGRRGVAHAAFTIKELRELSKRAGATMGIVAPEDAFNAEVMKYAATERPRKRLTELMQKLAAPPLPDPPPPPPPAEPCAVRVQFQRSPVEFLADVAEPSRLAGVRVSCNALDGPPSASQRATPVEGSEYIIPATLVLRSVGYRSSPMQGAPFDVARGIVPNTGGRVDGDEQLYVTGWLKRGPNGVILTNVNDAAETAKALLADRAAGKIASGGGGGEAVREILAHTSSAPVLGFDAWSKIDALELERGAAAGKVREKVVDLHEMLAVAAPR